jgi:hypothetical protein
MAFMAGANSIFDGDKLLTTKNNDRDEDLAMFATLGLKSRPAFLPYASGGASSCGVDFEGQQEQVWASNAPSPTASDSHHHADGAVDDVESNVAMASRQGGCCGGGYGRKPQAVDGTTRVRGGCC